ncbi:MAG TPA: hypothetical protein VN840_08525 [Streptosporangiaceae bacterium]|nr:hypothetical protein [Streptosporangiaceae bacterium]
MNALDRYLGIFTRLPGSERCTACGGRGSKFRSFRRSVASSGDAGEHALLTRTRVRCLACTIPAGEDGGDD